MGTFNIFNNPGPVNWRYQVPIYDEKERASKPGVSKTRDNSDAIANMRGDGVITRRRPDAASSAESAVSSLNMAKDLINLTKLQILAQVDEAASVHSSINSQAIVRLLQ